MPPRRRLAALARAATGGAVAALTDAAARKAQELWLASAAYVGAVDLAFEGRSYDVVRATVMVSPVTSVRGKIDFKCSDCLDCGPKRRQFQMHFQLTKKFRPPPQKFQQKTPGIFRVTCPDYATFRESWLCDGSHSMEDSAGNE